VFFIVFAIWGLVAARRVYTNVLQDLPDINASNLNSLTAFAESSVITDKNGEELYKLFAENREYVEYSEISPTMVQATVATEDSSFWENDWLDYVGIIRAIKDQVLVKAGVTTIRAWWASTVTQQVVRALLLSRDKTIVRKMKERVLTFDVDAALEKYVLTKFWNLKWEDLKRKKKEIIMELYLNQIFLWNNAYWVEAAAQTYFAKSANELNVLESSIIAWIIQAPSRYNPYTNRIGSDPETCEFDIEDLCQWIVGWAHVTNKGEAVILSWTIRETIAENLTQKIKQLDLTKSSDNAKFINILEWSEPFDMTHEGKIYSVNYRRWRKDTVLFRMYRAWFITQEELKQSIIDGITIDFWSKKVNIKAPHFVFWVKDFILESDEFKGLDLDEDTLLKWGLTIKTSLDYTVQLAAEKALFDNRKKAEDQWAKNRSLLYMDSKNGDIIAYVGSADYNNDDIDGKVDMLRAKRQPWSSIKPLIYAYWFQTQPITIDTPIFDIPSQFGDYAPNNVDLKFEWIMPVRKALAWSRNITAIKTYFAAWQQSEILPFLRDVGMRSLDKDHDYGPALSLGAWEVPALELAQAYSHLSTLGEPWIINPIVEIRWADGKILYKKEIKKAKKVLQAGPAYLIWNILSNDANMPWWRPSVLRVYWFPNSTKSGTSNMEEDGKSKPRDWRLVLYTPSKVAITRAGNADASPLEPKWFWGSMNGPVFKDFFKILQDKWYVVQENHQPVDVSQVGINKISWKLATSSTPLSYITTTMGYNKTIPNSADTWMQPIMYDSLCWWAVSEFTPESDRKQWYVVQPHSFIWSQRDLNDIIKRFNAWNHTNSGDAKFNLRQERVIYNFSEIFVEAPKEPCEDRIPKEDLSIRLAINIPQANMLVGPKFPIEYTFVGSNNNRPIQQVVVFIDDKQIQAKRYAGWEKMMTDSVVVQEPLAVWEHTLKIMAIDSLWYANSYQHTITVGDDTNGPTIQTVSVKVLDGGAYQIEAVFEDDKSAVQWGKMLINKDLTINFDWKTSIFEVNEIWPVWYIVSDSNGNQTRDIIKLQDYVTNTLEE